MPRPPRAAPSLWPKEHGAYFQLALPQLTALLLGRPTTEAVLLAVAGVFAFLGHEPLLVALGRRGKRARETLGTKARSHAAILVLAAATSGAFGLVLSSDLTRKCAVVPLVCALAVGVLVMRGKDKTIGGEVLVGITFATALVPVAVASGVGLAVAVAAAGVWALGFATATLSVHSVVGSLKRDRPWARPTAIALSVASLLAAATPAMFPPVPLGVIAVGPSGIIGLGLVVSRTHPRHLRRVGWTLAATHALTLAILIVAVRAV